MGAEQRGRRVRRLTEREAVQLDDQWPLAGLIAGEREYRAGKRVLQARDGREYVEHACDGDQSYESDSPKSESLWVRDVLVRTNGHAGFLWKATWRRPFDAATGAAPRRVLSNAAAARLSFRY